MPTHHFLVGTFNTSAIFTLAFDSDARQLSVCAKSEATGPHSWLSLNSDRSVVYATAWTEPPGLAAYRINTPFEPVKLINSVTTRARSGYCCNSSVAVYSAGGPTGEVYSIDQSTGGFKKGENEVLQALSFVDQQGQRNDGSVMDFGGLRHGAHSADLSPDGKLLFIADIGRNCIFVYRVNPEDGSLTLTDKNLAPRPTDGPRHVTPHPNGKYVYSLQEHTSMVDVFEVIDGEKLAWKQGVKIIPVDDDCGRYWADEVRLSPSGRYLYASTRGLEASTRGWLAVFEMDEAGLLPSDEPVAMWETPTSGGWANAVEPAFEGISTLSKNGGRDLLALTDSEEGWVMVLSWDGKECQELARVKLENGAGAATAVWLD